MSVLSLAQGDDLNPKRVASTNGGEYHSPCPGCGGRDRFIIWDETDRYLCRQCQKKGDAIQYYRDFRGMSYPQACEALRVEPKRRSSPSLRRNSTPIFTPQNISPPPAIWQSKAQEFIDVCHKQLLQTPFAFELFRTRGFTLEMIEKFRFGWNPIDLWFARSDWGLEEAEGKKLWLPQGLVIPIFDPLTGRPCKLKVRRNDHEVPKYVEISGSMQSPAVFLSPSMKLIAVITEAEFDAMLVHQFAADLCFTVALGGSTKRPDVYCDQLLRATERIIFALDVDQAGANAFRWWKASYSNLQLWLPPVGKSPGDAWVEGIDLRYWIVEGICESAGG